LGITVDKSPVRMSKEQVLDRKRVPKKMEANSHHPNHVGFRKI
jgi:hypothetical protein